MADEIQLKQTEEEAKAAADDKGKSGKPFEDLTPDELAKLSSADFDRIMETEEKPPAKKVEETAKKSDRDSEGESQSAKELHDKIEKLEKQVNDKESFYQKRETKLRQELDTLRKQVEERASRFETTARESEAEKRVKGVEDEISSINDKLRDTSKYDLSDVERERLEERRVDLKIDLKQLKAEVSRGRESVRSEEADNIAKEKAKEMIWDVYQRSGAHIFGNAITTEKFMEVKEFQQEHDLPSWIDAAYAMRDGDVRAKLETTEKNYSELKAKHDALWEEIHKARQKRMPLNIDGKTVKAETVDRGDHVQEPAKKPARKRLTALVEEIPDSVFSDIG